MRYTETYHFLKDKINYQNQTIDIGDSILVENFPFTSKNFNILPGEKEYACVKHNYSEANGYEFENQSAIVKEILDIHDSQIQENIEFRYSVFKPKKTGKAHQVIILLHGFNEKYGYKYFPWAKRLVELTGKSVILFPMAFHMNRAPQSWSDRHLMQDASQIRKTHFPDILSSSLSNVAISTRIHAKPQRFLWSGLQSYYDIIDLIEQIKSGAHPSIDTDAQIDLAAFSIGAFLSQILMLTNYQGYFSASKLAMICGGAVFNRISPVSKFILDSEANVNLYSFIVEHLESHLKKDKRLAHYLSDKHPEGISFRAMLNYNERADFREAGFLQMKDRLMAVVLKQDKVFPPYEVINTLQGRYRDVAIRVDTLDFPFPYKHEDPFPINELIKDQVDEAFEHVFSEIGSFLK